MFHVSNTHALTATWTLAVRGGAGQRTGCTSGEPCPRKARLEQRNIGYSSFSIQITSIADPDLVVTDTDSALLKEKILLFLFCFNCIGISIACSFKNLRCLLFNIIGVGSGTVWRIQNVLMRIQNSEKS